LQILSYFVKLNGVSIFHVFTSYFLICTGSFKNLSFKGTVQSMHMALLGFKGIYKFVLKALYGPIHTFHNVRFDIFYLFILKY
jgi:hypothetical protein